MATSQEYMKFISEQLGDSITYKKMFGEYGLYYSGKYFACVCDNRLLVKITKAGQALLPNCPQELPYEGGSPMLLIEELDDRALLAELVRVTCDALPAPKPKKKK